VQAPARRGAARRGAARRGALTTGAGRGPQALGMTGGVSEDAHRQLAITYNQLAIELYAARDYSKARRPASPPFAGLSRHGGPAPRAPSRGGADVRLTPRRRSRSLILRSSTTRGRRLRA
jgi:hypothetical protein